MTTAPFVSIPEEVLQAYSSGTMSAIDVRRSTGATFADILVGLASLDLPFPRASTKGREDELRQVREWLFPHAG
jgi:hypothetical protein